MHLNTLSLGVLLLGTTLAAPPKGAGSKGGNPAPPKGGGGRAPPLPGSIAEGKLPIRPAALGQASSSKASAKQIKIGDVFEVISGKKKDSCDQYYDAKAAPGKSEKLLNQYWDQVYTFTVAGQQAAGEKYEASAEKRKLVQSFFGIPPAEKGKLPMLGLEAEAMDKVDGMCLGNFLKTLLRADPKQIGTIKSSPISPPQELAKTSQYSRAAPQL